MTIQIIHGIGSKDIDVYQVVCCIVQMEKKMCEDKTLLVSPRTVYMAHHTAATNRLTMPFY